MIKHSPPSVADSFEQAASPQLRVALRKKLRSAVLAGVVCGIAMTASTAQAQVTETSPGEFTASGANTTAQAAAADNANVVTEEGFSVVTTDPALTIVGSGNLRYTDEYNSTLAGQYGLQVVNAGDFSDDDVVIPGAVEITTGGDITGDIAGIFVNNNGNGPTSITATGNVTGLGGYGIAVFGESEAGDVTINANNVTAADTAIYVEAGTALRDVSITTTGTVTGSDTEYGIWANTGGDVRIETQGDVTGGEAIYAGSSGTGQIEVITQGTVTGTAGNAISIYSYSQEPANVTATVNNARGEGGFGISLERVSPGSVEVNVNGTVEGALGGMLLQGENTPVVNIAEGGVVRNTDEDSSSLAIALSAQGSVINNNGSVIGRIDGQSSSGNDVINNNGLWHITNTYNALGGGENTINNNTGGVLKAASDEVTSYTELANVNTFVNAGDIDLRNSVEEEEEEESGGDNIVTFDIQLPLGAAGDILSIGSLGQETGEFRSEGGRLFVDVDFEEQRSDVLAVGDVTLGSAPTRVFVTPQSDGAPTTGDGILVVDVAGTSDDAFVLGNSVGRGLYSYQLGRGLSEETDQSWFLRDSNELRGEVPMVSALTVLAGRTSLATLSSPHERQREGDDSVDYYTRRTGTRLVSRAFTLPEDEQVARKGVWGRVFGQNNEFSADGGTNAGYDATLWGAQAGIDLIASGSMESGRTYGGVYLGYATSRGDALRGGTRLGDLEVNAASIGAYYTRYSSNGFYWDATAQYSRLDNAELKYAGDNAKSEGSSYLASLEAGKQLNRESKYVAEVQGQLLYQKTNIDDMRLADSTRFDVGNLSGMTGRVGVRLARNAHQGASVQPWLRADLWRTFNQDVRVSSLGESVTTPAGGTTGEVQLGFSLVPQSSGGWSAYVAGGYQFDVSGSEYSGWKGALGVRKGW